MTGHDVVDLARKFEDYGVEGDHLHRHRPRRHAVRHQHRSDRRARARDQACRSSRAAACRPSPTSRSSRSTRPKASSAPSPAARSTRARSNFKDALKAAANGSRRAVRLWAWPSASSPASTSRPAASSRASTSSTCATPATRSRSRAATTSRAPTSSRSSTSRASVEKRGLLYDMIEAVASQVFIPLTVGGGVSAASTTCARCSTPAPTRSASTPPACRTRDLVAEASARYGAQCIVVAIDAKKYAGRRSGRSTSTAGAPRPASTRWNGREEVVALGAGEILLTSMDRDGARTGFDLRLTRAVSDAVDVPVIASRRRRLAAALVDGIMEGGADAVLAARSSTTANSPSARRRRRWRAARHRSADDER